MNKGSVRPPGRATALPSARLPEAGLALLLFALYLVTLLPGPGYSGDTANFQFVGRVLGIPHPTGYPLYVVLNHIFVTLFPLGSHAYRANLLSAILAVLAAVVLLRFLVRLGMRPAAAFAAAFTFGVTPAFWSQAVVAEVYSLNILFIVLVLDRLVQWQARRRTGDFLLASCLYALSFGNHLSMILLLPGFIAFVLLVDRSILRKPRIAAGVALAILLGMLQYGYLFWRTSDPSLRYSEMWPGGINAVVGYVTGGPFRERMFSLSPAAIVTDRLPLFLRFGAREFLWAIPFVLLGMFHIGNRAMHWLLGLLLFATILYGVGYAVDDVWVFFLPAWLVLAVYLGAGLEFVIRGAGRYRRGAVSAALLLPLSFVAVNYRRVDRSGDTGHAIAVTRALATVDRDAMILSPSPMISEFFWYYLIGEGWEKRNIHLVHHVDAARVAEYIRDGRPFLLPEERRPVPVGLRVYDWAASHRRELEDAGLALTPAGGDLYRVGTPPSSADSTR